MVTKKNINVDIKGVLNSLEDTTIEQTKDTIEKTNTTTETNIDTAKKFIIKKKVDDKKDKKAFNVYMADSLVRDLDKLSKKSGWSRNEIINMMCQYCVNNLELVED